MLDIKLVPSFLCRSQLRGLTNGFYTCVMLHAAVHTEGILCCVFPGVLELPRHAGAKHKRLPSAKIGEIPINDQRNRMPTIGSQPAKRSTTPHFYPHLPTTSSIMSAAAIQKVWPSTQKALEKQTNLLKSEAAGRFTAFLLGSSHGESLLRYGRWGGLAAMGVCNLSSRSDQMRDVAWRLRQLTASCSEHVEHITRVILLLGEHDLDMPKAAKGTSSGVIVAAKDPTEEATKQHINSLVLELIDTIKACLPKCKKAIFFGIPPNPHTPANITSAANAAIKEIAEKERMPFLDWDCLYAEESNEPIWEYYNRAGYLTAEGSAEVVKAMRIAVASQITPPAPRKSAPASRPQTSQSMTSSHTGSFTSSAHSATKLSSPVLNDGALPPRPGMVRVKKVTSDGWIMVWVPAKYASSKGKRR